MDLSKRLFELAGKSLNAGYSKFRLFILFVLLIFYTGATSQTIRYVMQGGNSNGGSWWTASGDLQATINAAQPGTSIYVAAGTYQRPAGQSFSMKEGVKIYGGFAATGDPVFAERNWAIHPTILQGNNATVINNNNNGLTNSTILDGFTITGGNTDNSGGGISNVNSYPQIVNCIIKNNSTNNWGGGIFNSGPGSTKIINCLFYANAAGGGGAAFDYAGATTSYINVTIANNHSANNGGGIHTHNNAAVTIVNSIIYNNTATTSGSQFFSSAGCTVTANYSLFENNSATVSGTLSGANNLSGNPLFINPGGGDYRIMAVSPAFNSGNAALFPNAANAYDLAKNPRIFYNVIDMGAFENQQITNVNADGILYVRKDAVGSGASWSDAIGELSVALRYTKMVNQLIPENVKAIWVAKGTYTPMYHVTAMYNNIPTDRNNTFLMQSDVKLYGHFNGNETALAQRDFANTANETVLSGDFLNNDTADADGLPSGNLDENAYHVVVAVDISGAALDGFTLSGANANGVGSLNINGHPIGRGGGGGIVAYLTGPIPLTNLVIKSNYGTSMAGGSFSYFSGTASKLKIHHNNSYTSDVVQFWYSGMLENSTISNNRVDGGGGSLNIQQSSGQNLIIRDNQGGYCGGAIMSNVTLYNVLFTGNSSYEAGAVLAYENSTLVNCTFTGNTGALGSAINVENYSDLQLSNSIVAFNGSDTAAQIRIGNNSTLVHTNNLVQGSGGSNGWNNNFGTNNGNNLDADPLFMDGSNGNYELQPTSPAKDTGDNSLYPETAPATDLANNLRILNGIIDIGAFEKPFSQIVGEEGILYVVQGATGAGDSWDNAMGELANALKIAKLINGFEPGKVKEIWVAKGTYKPLHHIENINSANPIDRNNTFYMQSGIKIYGHFNGDESALSQRDFTNAANETILSGDFLNNDSFDVDGLPSANLEENAFHIIVAIDITEGALDGFTISGGNANGGGFLTINGHFIASAEAAGMFVQSTGLTEFTNLIIKSNTAGSSTGIKFSEYTGVASNLDINHNKVEQGAIVYLAHSGTLENSTISNNYSANGSSLGLFDNANSGRVQNLVVSDNVGLYGGGVSFSDGGTLYNSLITGNTAYEGGGAEIYGTATMVNCTITGNTGNFGSAIYVNYGSVLNLKNSILAFNGPDPTLQIQTWSSMVQHTQNLVQGSGGSAAWNTAYGVDNGGNIDADPLFTDAANGDYSLQDNSPAINAGGTSLYPDAATSTDLAGNIRVFGASIDMGVYESQAAGSCGTLTVWNGTTWSNGTPSSYIYSATIEGDYDSAMHGEIKACTLNLNSGTVTVAGGDNFIIKGVVTVNPTSSLTFENNANLLQEDDVENSGIITYNRNSNPLYNLDFTIWSSPVSGSQTLKQFSPQTLDAQFYIYNTTLNAYSNYLSASGILGGNPNVVPFTLGKGYLIRMPNGISANSTTVFNGSFIGRPNNGNVPISVLNTGNRYNAIGNPYPSPVNVRDFILENNDVLDNGTLYFWRKRNGTSGTSYATVTLAAYVSATAEGGDTSADAFEDGEEQNWVINAGQGFHVKVTPAASTVRFENSMRRAVNNNQFFRVANATPLPSTATAMSKMWLNITNNTGDFGQAAVVYSNVTTLGLDYGYDGRLFNDGQVAIYTLAENTRLSIQARPDFTASDEVPLGYKVTVAGNYSISLNQFTGVFQNGQEIFLRDNLLGIDHPLNSGAYTFSTEVGNTDNRFAIVYAATLEVAEIHDPNSVMVWKQNKIMGINSGNATMAEVKIFDIRGRLLYHNNKINASIWKIDNLNVADQVLMVQITTTEGVIINKKIIF